MFDWNDVRHFLAVARSGSTLTASHKLKVSQPTVARRVAALEDGLGLKLFERRRAGYKLAGEGGALLPAGGAGERGASALADGAAARAGTLEGVVRLTCNEMAGAAQSTDRGAARRLARNSGRPDRDRGPSRSRRLNS